jgi:hypothetical protein
LHVFNSVDVSLLQCGFMRVEMSSKSNDRWFVVLEPLMICALSILELGTLTGSQAVTSNDII